MKRLALAHAVVASLTLLLAACSSESPRETTPPQPAPSPEAPGTQPPSADAQSATPTPPPSMPAQAEPDRTPFPPATPKPPVLPVPQEEIKASLRPEEWQLLWSDEFNYEGQPNPDIWGFDVGFLGYNDEKQHYTDRPENAQVTGGRLIITACREDYEGAQYTSARMVTKGKKLFSQARVEVRARFTDGRGTWPAIWLLGENEATWPACGEIDIMEHVGAQPNGIHGSFHTANYNHRTDKHATDWVRVGSVGEPHVYACEWDDRALRIFVDDVEYVEVKRDDRPDEDWPLTRNHPYFVILNIAVGGFWGGMYGIDDRCFPQTMEVDYVRVFTKKPWNQASAQDQPSQ